MTHILDTNRNTTGRYDRLKAAGYDTLIRYVSRGGGDKVVTVAEARATAAAEFKLVLVYEVNGRPRGADVGHADGVFALAYAQKVGAPQGAILLYTADEDTTGATFGPTRDAFKAFAAAIAPMYRCGGYGSGWLLDQLFAAKIIVGRWITDSAGFRGSKEAVAAGRYEMKQALPSTIAGLDADADAEHYGVDGTAPDIGAFAPFFGKLADIVDPVYPPGDATPPAHDTEWVQASLNKIMNAGLVVDGDPGPNTKAAVAAFQKAHPPLVVDGIAGPKTKAMIEQALPK